MNKIRFWQYGNMGSGQDLCWLIVIGGYTIPGWLGSMTWSMDWKLLTNYIYIYIYRDDRGFKHFCTKIYGHWILESWNHGLLCAISSKICFFQSWVHTRRPCKPNLVPTCSYCIVSNSMPSDNCFTLNKSPIFRKFSRPPETIAKTLALAAQERSMDPSAKVRSPRVVPKRFQGEFWAVIDV